MQSILIKHFGDFEDAVGNQQDNLSKMLQRRGITHKTIWLGWIIVPHDKVEDAKTVLGSFGCRFE